MGSEHGQGTQALATVIVSSGEFEREGKRRLLSQSNKSRQAPSQSIELQAAFNLPDNLTAVVPGFGRYQSSVHTQTRHPPAEALEEHAQIISKGDAFSVGYSNLKPNLPGLRILTSH